MFDLEIWLIGTPSEVDTATTALATAGRLVGASRPEPLYGADAGRTRRYLRLRVPTPAATPADRRRGPATAGQAVIDLDTRRRTA